MVYHKFIVHENVLSVLPPEDTSHESIVLLEGGKTIRVNRSQTNVIRDSCNKYMEPFDYVKKIVRERFKFIQKTPVFVNTNLLIYMFPTCSDANEDVIWINVTQIAAKYKNRKNDGHTDIYFNCGTKLTVDVSLHTITKQYERTNDLLCKVTHARKIKLSVGRR